MTRTVLNLEVIRIITGSSEVDSLLRWLDVGRIDYGYFEVVEYVAEVAGTRSKP